MVDRNLRELILQMAADDQTARHAALARRSIGNRPANRRIFQVDARNRSQIKKIVAEYGWPTFDMVGKKAATAFWLLVQHCDEDPAFQRACWLLMGRAVKAGQASGKEYAYLIDRVRLNAGKPQLFGTQFTIKDGATFSPRPIWNARLVDERRAKYGLEPLWRYARRMQRNYPIYRKRKLELPKGYQR